MRILYVDIDSLRPDHLGCYGYQRPTSPSIDQIAAQGAIFTNYFCSDSPCVPSRAACFSGRPGIQNGIVAHEDTPAGSTLRYTNRERHGDAPMWMHHLAQAGFQTISFSSFANRHLAGWFHFGFRQFNLSSLKNGDEDADEVNAVALPWFEKHGREDNWFVHLNYWDPHTLYTVPVEYMHMMGAYPAPLWPDEAAIQQQQALTGIRTPQMLWCDNPLEGNGKSLLPTMPDAIEDRRDFEHLINSYDGAIRFADDQFRLVLQALEDQGVLDETAIIISADHAEAFGELGQYMEHGTVSPAVNRIPLIVRWPGITEAAVGRSYADLLLNIDLAPTVSAGLGLSLPAGWAGTSFLPLLQGRVQEEPRERLIFGHGLHTRQRAVYDGQWLYIRTYHPGLYEYPPQLLFDLSVDPNQTRNLAAEQPERTQLMDAQLLAWEREQVQITGQEDPMRVIQQFPPIPLSRDLSAYTERLRKHKSTDDVQRFQERWRTIDRDYAPAPLV